MNLYAEWKNLLDNQTDETFESFWKEYSDAEVTIYTHILSHSDENLKGNVKELSEKFECRTVMFEGFLDGILSSLNKTIDVQSVTEETEIEIDVDYEKLYYNMWKADAPHLYSLDPWDALLTPEKKKEIVREFKKSKIYRAPAKVGRNQPCPCGSGKKYKNCCGKN
ncbi:MAG: SEC-C metal-binding domain-containing protein [Hornefia sp.]|nr:SEC-C metal-binding domain-containing protein [Hornefia sp.]